MTYNVFVGTLNPTLPTYLIVSSCSSIFLIVSFLTYWLLIIGIECVWKTRVLSLERKKSRNNVRWQRWWWERWTGLGRAKYSTPATATGTVKLPLLNFSNTKRISGIDLVGKVEGRRMVRASEVMRTVHQIRLLQHGIQKWGTKYITVPLAEIMWVLVPPRDLCHWLEFW